MKKSQQLLKMLALSLGLSGMALKAQAPQKFNYQALVRNSSNALLSNSAVAVRISILQGSANGTAVYTETHKTQTNINGLLNVEIGTGTVANGEFAKINWSQGPYFIKNEVDPQGGTNYSLNSTSQMMSVPYALYAANGLPKANNTGDTLSWNGTEWVTSAASANTGGKTYIILQGDISNAQAAKQIADEYGPNTSFVWVRGTTQLTSLDLSKLSQAVGLKIENNQALTELNISKLTTVFDELIVQDNPVLAKISFPALNSIGGYTNISSNASLTSTSFPVMVNMFGTLSYKDNPLLNSINAPALKSIGYFTIEAGNLVLTDLKLSALSKAKSIFISDDIKTIDLPVLTSVERIASGIMQNPYNPLKNLTSFSAPLLTNGTIELVTKLLSDVNLKSLTNPKALVIASDALTTIDLPALKTIESLTIRESNYGFSYYKGALTSFSAPLLTTADDINISGHKNLTSLKFPALKNTGGLSLQGSSLKIIEMPVLSTFIKSSNGVNMFSFGSNLPSSEINNILAKLVAIKAVGYFDLGRQNPPAPPTGQGLIDKASLQAAGSTVQTD